MIASRSTVACKHSRAAAPARPAAPAMRRSVRAAASGNDEANYNSNTGFVQKDTAGQTNMYPILPKAYEAGSSNDSTSDAGNTTTLAAAAGAAAAGAIIFLALTVLSNSGADSDAGQYAALSEYAAKFAAEL